MSAVSMTPHDALADIERTIALWRADGVTARVAWLAITGNRARLRRWRRVRLIMVRIALGRQPNPTRPPRRHPKHRPVGRAATVVRRRVPGEQPDPWAGMGECFA